MPISLNHPLRRLFTDLVSKELPTDREVAAYVANLLIDFTHVDHLYRIRNSRGKRLEEVGEMLVESNPLLNATSFEREREVRKHIGDYALPDRDVPRVREEQYLMWRRNFPARGGY